MDWPGLFGSANLEGWAMLTDSDIAAIEKCDNRFRCTESEGPGAMLYKLELSMDSGTYRHVKPYQWADKRKVVRVANTWARRLATPGQAYLRDNWERVSTERLF